MRDAFQRDPLHPLADRPCLGKIKTCLRTFVLQFVQHALLRGDDELLLPALGRITDDAAGGANVICQSQDLGITLRVGQDLRLGMESLLLFDLSCFHIFMHRAVAVRDDDVFFRHLLGHMAGQILIRDK